MLKLTLKLTQMVGAVVRFMTCGAKPLNEVKLRG